MKLLIIYFYGFLIKPTAPSIDILLLIRVNLTWGVHIRSYKLKSTQKQLYTFTEVTTYYLEYYMLYTYPDTNK